METTIGILGLLLNIIELYIVARAAGLAVPLSGFTLRVEFSVRIEVRHDK